MTSVGAKPRLRAGLTATGFLLLLGVAGPSSLAAQAGEAVIVGHVTDRDSGAGVEGAVVMIRGTLLNARSDGQGHFRIARVPAGRYTLTTLAIGFATDSVIGVSVAAGDSLTVTIVLRPAPVSLADIVVTANRSPQRLEEAGASVTTLPAQELVRRNVVTLDQALQFEPGVTFNAGEMDIRGSTGLARGVGSRVLLLLDGHPILSGDGGEIDFESVPLLDVERVEVVKGAYSAQYGGGALGGVVNVLTTPIGHDPETTVRGHFGAWQFPDRFRYATTPPDERGFGLQHSRRLGDIGFRLYLGRETSDGYRQDDEKARWVSRVKLSSAAGSTHPWDVYAVWAKERDGEFFTWRSDSQPFQVDPSTVDDHEIDYKLLTGASYMLVARSNALLRISPYVNYNSVQNHFPSDGNQDHHRATRLGSTLNLSLRPWTGHALEIGGDVAHTLVTSNFLGIHSINDDAVFLQDEWRFADRWTASFGGRLDYHQVSGGREEWSPSPKVALIHQPTSWLSLHLSAGHGFRSPSAIEQFVDTRQFGYRVVPNPDNLSSERAWSEEVGMTFTPLPQLRLDGTAFQNQYRDLIGPVVFYDTTLPNPEFRAQFRNVTRAHVRGVDLSVKSRLFGNFMNVEASYLFLRTRDDSSGLPLPYRSRHNVTGTLSLLGGLLDVDVRYRSRVETVLQYFTDPRSHFTVVDLRMGYRIAGVAVQAKVSNLLQTFYVDVQERNPGAPRQVSFTAFRRF